MTVQSVALPPDRFAARRLATPRSNAKMLRLQVLAELHRHLRAPDFAVAAIALPIAFYVMFGSPRATEPVPGGGTVGGYTAAVFAIYGILSIGLFGIGSTITEERGRGDFRLIRTTPLPAAVYLGSKLTFVVVASAAMVALMGVLASATGAGIDPSTWATTAVILVFGAVALAPLGFLLGFLVRPGSAMAVGLLILMPLSLTAGVFMTVDELPSAIHQLAQLTPTYHLSMLVLTVVRFARNTDPAVDAAWVVAWGIGGAAAALAAYRRFVGSQFA